MTKKKGQKCSNTSGVFFITEHQKILEKLIDLRVLISPPIMAYPKFVLHIDECHNELGAILHKRQSTGKSGVIAYGSRTLTSTKKDFFMHSGKLEFLVLKWSVT